MLSVVWDLIQKYNVIKVLVDASAPSFIRALKLEWGERTDYENIEKELRDYMRVEPVAFGVEHKLCCIIQNSCWKTNTSK
jgi:hypothetical protein